MTSRNQIHDHQTIMNLLRNDMNTTTMFYGGEPERSETLIQNGNKGYRFQGAQILFSVTTPHSRDPNQIQTTKLSDLRTPSSSENELGEQLLTEPTTRGTESRPPPGMIRRAGTQRRKSKEAIARDRGSRLTRSRGTAGRSRSGRAGTRTTDEERRRSRSLFLRGAEGETLAAYELCV